MARKRIAPPGKKGLDGWVMTYGDMMSLLLTFFVLLVSFSSLQESKFEEAALSLRDAFGVMKEDPSVIQQKEQILSPMTKEQSDLLYEVRNLEQSLLDTGLDQEVEIEITEEGVRIRINAPFLFASGKADLQPRNAAVLDSLAGFVGKVNYPVRIEGHTDSVPIRTVRFPSNWELSASRAISVARFFQERGIDPDRLAAIGYGEFRPLETNETPEGRARNRRVEIFLNFGEEPEVESRLPLLSEENNHGG